MRCLYPRTVGFRSDGKTISWSPKYISKEFAQFQLPCGKCIECRLQYGMEWAIRCVKEAMMYENNCFLTLTYNPENLGENKLDYRDIQLFIKKLRNHIHEQKVGKDYWNSLTPKEKKQYRKDHKDELEKIRIGLLIAGEYGDQNKRKHWHAIIFNYRPTDGQIHDINDRGDKIYVSDTIDRLWNKGHTNYGDVTLESASYVARYSLKKLKHGQDGDHEYEPISKKSSKNAIGKAWLEKYWKNVFQLGYVEHEGTKHAIPRYFEKWFKKNKPELWEEFIKNVKSAKISLMTKREEQRKEKIAKINEKRSHYKGHQVTELETKRIIAKQKLETLQKFQKI